MKKIRKIINDIVEWFNGLDGKHRLIAAIFALIIIAALAYLLSKIRITGSLVNYKELNIENIESMTVNTNKELYMQCDAITKRLMQTYYGNYSISNQKVTLKDFYEYTKVDEYNLSRSKFEKRLKNIFDELQEERKASVGDIDSYYPIIEDVYEYKPEYKMYIIKFATAEDHVMGIQIRDQYFYVFFLE